MSKSEIKASRRSFIKNTSAIAAAAMTLPTVMTGRAEEAKRDTLNVGVVGLGGRGSGAVINALRADAGVKIIAIAEAFKDRLKSGLHNIQKADGGRHKDRIDVPEERQFVGFDAYKELLKTDVDVVILTTAPHFRPLHAEACIHAGKHVFAEKPLATDAAGLRRILNTVKKAKEENLSFMTGFCYRFHKGMIDTFDKIKEGAIGDLMYVQSSYNVGGLWHRGNDVAWSQMEYQMRNWLYFNWLSGDHIVEQSVHNLDKLNWVMGDNPPVSCLAMGGRMSRTDKKYGNIYDHFSANYDYGNDIFANVTSRQQHGCDNSVHDYVKGTKGYADIMKHRITGEAPWRFNTKKRFKNMYDAEHDVLFKHLRRGDAFNNGEVSVISTGLAIMARMSAYTGKRVYWNQEGKPSLMTSKEDLTPAKYEWGKIDTPEVPVAGRTKFI